MDDVSRQKVDIVVEQLDASIPDALASQLIQFRILNPLDALRNRWLVQIQLQFFHQMREITCVESDHVFGDAILRFRLAASDGFQDACDCIEKTERIYQLIWLVVYRNYSITYRQPLWSCVRDRVRHDRHGL